MEDAPQKEYQPIAEELIRMGVEDLEERRNRQHPTHPIPYSDLLDKKHLSRLKEIITDIGWPGISRVGKVASHATWILAQHADSDPEFQEKALKEMKKTPSDVSPQNIAYLSDRVAVNKGEGQLFGTQFYQNETGEITPRPISDPEHLEQRREEMGLEPFTLYEQKMRGEFVYPADYIPEMLGPFPLIK